MNMGRSKFYNEKYAYILVFVCRQLGRSPQNTDHADCRLCRLSNFFFLYSFLHLFLSRIFFVSGHKLVFSYISECLLTTGRACSVCDVL